MAVFGDSPSDTTDAKRRLVGRLLEGAVDMHVHPAPSPYARRIDTLEAARSAAEAGMRAIVVKSHHHSTATDVASLGPHGLDATGVEVVGGIVLNTEVGGINPNAVGACLAMGGRVVWLPTVSSPAHIAYHSTGHANFPTSSVSLPPEHPIDVWDGEGRLKPEMKEILAMIAEADGILASGHLPPESILAVFEAAREAGVRRMVVNHPNFIVNLGRSQVRRLIELGAKVEHALCHYDDGSRFHEFPLRELVDWVRWAGIENSYLASDLGQTDNPLPVESFRAVCLALLEEGFTEAELRALVADNPGAVLGG